MTWQRKRNSPSLDFDEGRLKKVCPESATLTLSASNSMLTFSSNSYSEGGFPSFNSTWISSPWVPEDPRTKLSLGILTNSWWRFLGFLLLFQCFRRSNTCSFQCPHHQQYWRWREGEGNKVVLMSLMDTKQRQKKKTNQEPVLCWRQDFYTTLLSQHKNYKSREAMFSKVREITWWTRHRLLTWVELVKQNGK